MRVLKQAEVAVVAGGLMDSSIANDPNFSGQYGCPANYSGATLYTTTTTYSGGSGSTTTGMTSGSAGTKQADPVTTTKTNYVCLPDVPGAAIPATQLPASSSGSSDTSGTGSTSNGADQAEDDAGVCMVP